MKFDWRMAVGGIAAGSDPAFVDRVRRKVQARVEQTSVRYYRRRPAEKRIEAATCEAIVETFAEFHPDRRWFVTRDWPRAFVMISHGEAIIEPWLGIDWMDDGDGIEPVRVPVDYGQQKPSVLDGLKSALPWLRGPMDLTQRIEDPPAPVSHDTKPAATAKKTNATMDMLTRRKTKR